MEDAAPIDEQDAIRHRVDDGAQAFFVRPQATAQALPLDRVGQRADEDGLFEQDDVDSLPCQYVDCGFTPRGPRFLW